jgi:hypothetical protein
VGYTRFIQESVQRYKKITTRLNACTGKGKQDSHQSWWPKTNAWNKSTLNIGHWTETCEEWFQIRLQNIRQGRVQLRNGQEWTRLLNMNHKMKKVMEANKSLATKYIA